MMIARNCSRLLKVSYKLNHVTQYYKMASVRLNKGISCLNVGYFSTAQKVEKMQFKAQTKKLLDIVAKSLYTDNEVFLRELLSNASDALQKQRFKEQANENLNINIELVSAKKQIIIEDNGIGMSKQELIDNLGTIAKSGSKQYIEQIMSTSSNTSDIKDNIIGQFGVGFYSAFIVADQVQVISKSQGAPAYQWVSDGTGQFQISQVEEDALVRGTKIIIHLKQQHQHFVQKTEIEKITQKYSNFINFPITINGEAINLVKALWCRNKNEISQQQYQKFYEYLSNTSQKYQYKLHLISDVPLSIKSVMYIPKTHGQKFGLAQEKGQVHLYSRKVLIKKNCKDILLPNFLRFVKGVVDCQDIPLNISREGYQDSALMGKIRSFVTKRILKYLKETAAKDSETYNRWFNDFTQFIKEGSLDSEFKNEVIPLNRYEVSSQDGLIDLKQYIEMKKPNQDRILYVYAPSRTMAQDSPYIYPLSKANVPVLIANTHIDQIIFRQIENFQGLKFANIQTDVEDVQRILKGLGQQQKNPANESKGVSEDDITSYSLWIKNQLQPYVDKVQVTNKEINGPAMVISPVSSSMRQMAFMRMMVEQKLKQGNSRQDLRNLTFEYNSKDPLIVKLNEYRKQEPQNASMIIRQIFDNCCMQAGMQSDGKSMIIRINKFMQQIINKPSLINSNEQK